MVLVIGPLVAGALAIGVGLTESPLKAAAAGGIVFAVRMIEDYVVIPRVLGHAIGLLFFVVLVFVSSIKILFNNFYILLTIPITTIITTLINIIIHNINPTAQNIPTILF